MARSGWEILRLTGGNGAFGWGKWGIQVKRYCQGRLGDAVYCPKVIKSSFIPGNIGRQEK
jgi:hypothetical protein